MLQRQKLTSEKRKKSSLAKKKSFIGSAIVADPIKLIFFVFRLSLLSLSVCYI